MSAKQAVKSEYTNLKGIVVPESSRSEEDLALLTSDGKTIPLLKNEKYNFLKNLIWESVTTFGRIVKDPISKKEFLEVVFFSSAVPMSYIDLDSMESKKMGESMSFV